MKQKYTLKKMARNLWRIVGADHVFITGGRRWASSVFHQYQMENDPSYAAHVVANEAKIAARNIVRQFKEAAV